MAERLKSISKRINWSLLLRAVIFAAVWWVLPFWAFLLVALYLYFVPSVGARKVAAPFFALLLASFFEPQGWFAALVFGAVFYYILAVKDLVIIDRRGTYDVLMLVIAYLLVRGYFLDISTAPFGMQSVAYGLAAAWAMGGMAAGIVKHFSARTFGERRMIGWVAFLVVWQLIVVGSFLPLDFLYQSAIVFLVAVVLLDLVPQYIMGELTRRRALVTGMTLFALLVIVAASARWIL